jgi:hypothetical protein
MLVCCCCLFRTSNASLILFSETEQFEAAQCNGHAIAAQHHAPSLD